MVPTDANGTLPLVAVSPSYSWDIQESKMRQHELPSTRRGLPSDMHGHDDNLEATSVLCKLTGLGGSRT
jgi:hypothetical protein